MKTFIAALCISLVFCLSAAAQTEISPAKKDLIHQFAALTKTNELNFNVTFSAEGLEKNFANMIDGDQKLTEAQKTELRKLASEGVTRVSTKSKELIEGNSEFQQIGVQCAFEIYDKAFTEDELKQLITFYQTPLGQRSAVFIGSVKNDIGTAFQQKASARMAALVNPLVDAETAAFTKELQNAEKAK